MKMELRQLIREYLNDIPGASSRGVKDCYDKIMCALTVPVLVSIELELKRSMQEQNISPDLRESHTNLLTALSVCDKYNSSDQTYNQSMFAASVRKIIADAQKLTA